MGDGENVYEAVQFNDVDEMSAAVRQLMAVLDIIEEAGSRATEALVGLDDARKQLDYADSGGPLSLAAVAALVERLEAAAPVEALRALLDSYAGSESDEMCTGYPLPGEEPLD